MLLRPLALGPFDLILSWTGPDGARPSAISPEPMCVKWTKFVGSPIMLRSIFLRLFLGGGLATTQQPILCQNSLIPAVLLLCSEWVRRPWFSLDALQAAEDVVENKNAA